MLVLCCKRLWGRAPKLVRHCSGTSTTALYDFHVSRGAKMVTFGGVRLPLQYRDQGVVASHLHTRTHASLFDVSHMLQTEITGAACGHFMERLCTADIQALPVGKATLTLFLDEKAHILDDLIVTKIAEDHLYVVSNAARKEHDQQLMLRAKAAFGRGVSIRFFDMSERSLLALQGPAAARCLQAISDRPLVAEELPFMTSVVVPVAGVDTCRITRCGYTGEDGFEISMPAIKSSDVAEALLAVEDGSVVRPAGLAARDSLRLEAGLCLYGSDIDETTSPAEAALMWLVAKRRRAHGDYPGAIALQEQIKTGPTRKRVGLVSEDGPPARHGTQIFSEDDPEKAIGEVTSGCPSPTLGNNIAMAYVSTPYSKVNTNLLFKLRNKFYKTVVTKMPFVKTNYFVAPK